MLTFAKNYATPQAGHRTTFSVCSKEAIIISITRIAFPDPLSPNIATKLIAYFFAKQSISIRFDKNQQQIKQTKKKSVKHSS